jgi:hypothetical protein
MCSDIKTFALPKAPKNPPQTEDVIAQSPTVNNAAKSQRSAAYNDKFSLAAFGSITLIFFGLAIR